MAILFQSQFTVPAFGDWDAPIGPNNNLIAGRGIDFGPAYTCSNNNIEKQFVAGDAVIQDLAIRVQYGLDDPSPGAFRSGIFQLGGRSITGGVPSFPGGSVLIFVDVDVDGSLIVQFANVPLTSFELASAPGVIADDGSMHGIQATFSFPSRTQCDFAVQVNNVTVINSSYSPVTGAFSCAGGAHLFWTRNYPLLTDCVLETGINRVALLSNNLAGTRRTSCAELIVDDVAAFVSYPPCNAVPADRIDGCSPFIPPASSAATSVFSGPSGSGIFG